MAPRNTRNREMGDRMRRLREEQGRTLVSVSSAAGYPYSWQLSKVELDGVMPDPERLTAIARELGTTAHYLLTGEERELDAVPPPSAVDVDAWVAMLPPGAPKLAVEMARNAWELAGGAMQSNARAPRAATTPTLTPPARSSSQSLVPPSASGMRSRGGRKKSVAPPAVKRRAR